MTGPALDDSARRLDKPEFIALIGMLFASVAFSIDAMLPALPAIAAELSPSTPNVAQLIIASFILGMGAGTLVTGPLSDSFGRKPVIYFGAALYVGGALLAWAGSSLEMLLLGRALQGLGAAGPRVVALALVRDQYEGRQMARIVSFAMMIFTLFPAVAPLIGSFIITAFSWRAIFLAFVLFSLISVSWLAIRQPETLPRSRRRSLSLRPLLSAIAEVMSTRVAVLSIAVQSAVFAMLLGTIAMVQPTFDTGFGQADAFAYWFAGIALVSAIPSLINASIVVRFGMRALIRLALLTEMILTGLVLVFFLRVEALGTSSFIVYLIWTLSLFSMVGFIMGNLNALAMQPLGHIAGTAASVIGAISTIVGGACGAVLGQFFDGTPIPQAIGVLTLSVVAVLLFRFVPEPDARPLSGDVGG